MKTILVIDDEPQIRAMLKKLFEREGYHVIVACDGKEGMKLFQESSADIVITDIIMPEKEGAELIRELRKSNPGLPIVAMSGGGEECSGRLPSYGKVIGSRRGI